MPRGNPNPSHATRFRPGEAWKGNPGGQPKAKADVIEMARKASPAAIRALEAALADPRQRVAAAVAILDRAWGRPKQALQVDGEIRSAAGGIDAPPRPGTVEDAEAWLERRRRELAALN